jgi:hypothetical protein
MKNLGKTILICEDPIAFRGGDIIGAALADDGRVLHLGAFSAVAEQGAGMARPGMRRLLY